MRPRSDHATDPRPLPPITGPKPQFPSLAEAEERRSHRIHSIAAKALMVGLALAIATMFVHPIFGFAAFVVIVVAFVWLCYQSVKLHSTSRGDNGDQSW